MKKIPASLLLLLSWFIAFPVHAGHSAEMADTMRSNGKIYVLLAIILVVFTGLITYLITIDRRVAKIEKKAGLEE
jgi:CcmD family protein